MIRRIVLGALRAVGSKVISDDVQGLHNEVFDSEVYMLHGFSAAPESGGKSLLLEVNGDANNHIALPSMRADTSDATAPETG